MTKQLGRKFLIKIGDGESTEAFTVLCGLTSKSFEINDAEIDVTTADCNDPGGALWTEVLSGVKRVSVSGNGLFKNEASETRLKDVKMSSSAICNFQVIIPGFGMFEAAYHIGTLGLGGEQEGGVTYSLSLGSTGAVTFTAET